MNKAAPKSAGRWLTVFIGLVSLTTTLALWHAISVRERDKMTQTVRANAATVRNEIVARLDSRIRSLSRVASRWEYSGKPLRQVWEADVSSQVEDYPGYQGIAWVDSELKVQWIVPLARNLESVGKDMATEERRRLALLTARDDRKARFSQPVEMTQGGQGILATVPIYHQDQLEGFIVGGIRLRELLDATLTREMAAGYGITLTESGRNLYERSAGPLPPWSGWLVEVPVEIQGLNWSARVWPGTDLLDSQRSQLPGVVLGLGLLASILLTLSAHLARKAIARTRQMSATQGEMQREIIQRQHAEEAWHESQALYLSLVDQLPAGIFRKDVAGRFVFVNPWFCRIKGMPADQILGRTAAEIVDADLANPESMWRAELAAQGACDHEQIMRTGERIELEESYYGPSGELQRIQIVKSPVFGPDQKVIGSQGVLFDISKLKQVEAALIETSALLETLLRNSTDCIYFKDSESRFVHFSQSMLKLFNLNDASDLKGRTDFDFFQKEHALNAYQAEQEIIRTGVPLLGRIEREILKDGTESWALTSKMPVRHENGRITGTFGISKDITAIKKAEVELEVAHRQLLETSRRAGMAEVATSVLHNVGNVLNSVNVSCAVAANRVRESRVGSVAKTAALLREHEDDLAAFLTGTETGRKLPVYLGQLADQLATERAEVLGELQLLSRNIDHIREIVATQQNYAKVSGVAESVLITDLIEDGLRINEQSLASASVRVIREYFPLPPVTVEKHKALQILVNLICNARQACDSSGCGDPRITLRAAAGRNCVRVSVTDNGVGIPHENLTRIFAHGFTTKRNGHGFGLHSGAIAAREMGGSLTVHSDGPGTGATLTLKLPTKTPTELNP